MLVVGEDKNDIYIKYRQNDPIKGLTTNYFVLIELFWIDGIDLDNKHVYINSHVINEIHKLAMTNALLIMCLINWFKPNPLLISK